MHIHYNSRELGDFVRNLHQEYKIIQDYKPQTASRKSILSDLIKLSQCDNAGDACKVLNDAGAHFKREFKYTPVTDMKEYLKGATPTFDAQELARFVNMIILEINQDRVKK